MNKRDFTIWKEGMETAMAIMHINITCKQVEDNVAKEIERQAAIAEETDRKNNEIEAEFEKFFAGVDMAKSAVKDIIDNTDFGWEEPVKKVEKGIKNWQSRFREHFKDGPVNRKPRK